MSQEMSADHGPEPGSFCWTEIASNDAAKCKAFYSTTFGWKFQESTATDGEFAYHEFLAGNKPYPAGGMYDLSPEMCGENGEMPPPHFLSYVAVEDVDASAQRAADLGGTVVREPMDIPNTGRFAVIKDPAGALFAVFTMQSNKEEGNG